MKYLFIIGYLISFSLYGQSGTLKSDFGQSGKLVLDIDDLDDLVGILKDDQGNNYLYGNTSDNLGGVYPYDFFFAKMDEYGNLDPSFGTNGIFRGDFPGFATCSVKEARIHSSGIYFIGQGINPTSVDTFHIFVSKLSLNGQIDASFGTNGYFNDNLLGSYSTAGSLIIDDENRIIFCGSSEVQFNQQEFPVVGRLTLDGERDSTFGGTGILYWDYFSGSIVNLMELPDLPMTKHAGDGAFLSEIVQVNQNYFVFGRYVETAYAQLHMMAFDKQGDIPSNFITSGPFIYQLDPGYNHTVTAVEFHNNNIYLGISTNGMSYGGKHFVQKIDTNGYQQSIITTQENGIKLRTNFLESWNGKLFTGGYNLDSSNISPGYLSERFEIHCMDSSDQEISSFHFEEDMGSGDELGAKDIELHADYGIIGGYMNNVVGDNYTDIALMAFELDPSLEIVEEENHYLVYPNPTNGEVYFSQHVIGDFRLVDISGKQVHDGKIYGNYMDLSTVSSGTYFLQINDDAPIRMIIR